MNLVEAFHRFRPKNSSSSPVERPRGSLSFLCKPSKIEKEGFEKIKSILGDEWHGIRQADGTWELQRILNEEIPVRKLAILIRVNKIEIFDSQDEKPRLIVEDVNKIIVIKDPLEGRVMTAEKAYGLGRCILFLDQFLIRTEEVDDGRAPVVNNYPLLCYAIYK